MITLRQWMETVDYRITEGASYGWQCFGPDAYTLDSWNGEQDGHTFHIIFDTRSQEVYQVEVHDYTNRRSYRLTNPEYAHAFTTAVNDKAIEDVAYDDVGFTDLETDDDWLEKAEAIFNGEDYDTRVSVPIDIPDHELLQYMKMAHEMDMKFNDFVEMALRKAIEAHGIKQFEDDYGQDLG